MIRAWASPEAVLEVFSEATGVERCAVFIRSGWVISACGNTRLSTQTVRAFEKIGHVRLLRERAAYNCARCHEVIGDGRHVRR